MGLFLVYILKSAICLSAFYLFHRWLLSRETFHRFNRIALLSVLLLSLLIPFVKLSIFHRTGVNQAMLTVEELLLMAQYNNVAQIGQNTVEHPHFPWVQWCVWVYVLGVVFCVLRHTVSLCRLMGLLKASRKEALEKGISLYVHERAIAPFSWMNAIVISRKDLEENGTEIIIHERAHLFYRHSIDLLIADVCVFFQWFNPGAWLLKRELQNIHEYEADDKVLNEGVNAKQYQLLLIKKAVGTRLYSMANSFNHSKLKKRITMMLKEKSNPWARLKYLYVLPLVSIAVVAFARPEVSETLKDISDAKVNDLNAVVETNQTENFVSQALVDSVKPNKMIKTQVKSKTKDDEPLRVAEEMPQYPGGSEQLMKYLFDHIKYPKSAENKLIEGRVIVQFVVSKDGSVVNPVVVKSVNTDLDNEALRVVKEMPKWTPGKTKGKPVSVFYTVPVMFKLKDGKQDKSTQALKSLTSRPLVIVDGMELSSEEVAKIKPDQIKNISVLKDKSAKAIYGEKGENGVVIITKRTIDELKIDSINKINK